MQRVMVSWHNRRHTALKLLWGISKFCSEKPFLSRSLDCHSLRSEGGVTQNHPPSQPGMLPIRSTKPCRLSSSIATLNLPGGERSRCVFIRRSVRAHVGKRPRLQSPLGVRRAPLLRRFAAFWSSRQTAGIFEARPLDSSMNTPLSVLLSPKLEW